MKLKKVMKLVGLRKYVIVVGFGTVLAVHTIGKVQV
jgi:hypothetical protein